MSKRASAFERTSIHRAAGQIAPAASRSYEGGSEYSYDKSLVRRSSFILPVPQMFQPSEYLKGVEFDSYEAGSYNFANKIFHYIDKYIENTIKPWLEENDITKYRIYRLQEHERPFQLWLHEESSETSSEPTENRPDNMLWFERGGYYVGAGIIFKNPKHRILFKLTF